MSLELIEAVTILYIKILDLPSKPIYKHEIEASDNGDQVYVLAKLSTMGSHVFFLLVIHHF